VVVELEQLKPALLQMPTRTTHSQQSFAVIIRYHSLESSSGIVPNDSSYAAVSLYRALFGGMRKRYWSQKSRSSDIYGTFTVSKDDAVEAASHVMSCHGTAFAAVSITHQPLCWDQ